jgi:hypothetical protein
LSPSARSAYNPSSLHRSLRFLPGKTHATATLLPLILVIWITMICPNNSGCMGHRQGNFNVFRERHFTLTLQGGVSLHEKRHDSDTRILVFSPHPSYRSNGMPKRPDQAQNCLQEMYMSLIVFLLVAPIHPSKHSLGNGSIATRRLDIATRSRICFCKTML